MNEIRKKKIEKEIQRTIATLIITEKVKDPRISMVTIHRVDMADDMSQALVYYTAYCNNNERKKLANGLTSARGFLQSAIGKKLGLRHTPNLYFIWDKNYIKSIEVNRLIDESAPKHSLEPGFDSTESNLDEEEHLDDDDIEDDQD
ncbi:30S ribosome-binding factor RbfA [Leptospira sp. GIMC2001]|uniref:30S ribosome-binding factor RbfA n=1 Tax=Leptospira sp. GIMC2001 TaxID=1513297 RepID=UPI0023497BD8|nr:30S ribosome-binding factor RbfA [Leptospira sp. GIMC2001]WCL48088.1 30S ribosome-binding factor RbfA [Leptospira sp. GIMC2001]